MKFKTINKQIVKPMQTPDDLDKRPPRGQEMISAAYANIYACAKKKTGKTSVVAKMAMDFVGPETKVHVFCSTVFIDPTYIALGKWFDKHNIDYFPSVSIKDDDGHDLLNDIMAEDADFINPQEDEVDEPKTTIRLLDLGEPVEKKKRKKKSKYKDIRRLFIFDDLSNEIQRSASLKKLLKTNRHMQCKVIIASQWINDLAPQCINQLDYVFLFKHHNDEKLTEMHQKLDLSVELPVFLDMYRQCTEDKKKFHFLYIDRFEQYRRSFNKAIIFEEQ